MERESVARALAEKLGLSQLDKMYTPFKVWDALIDSELRYRAAMLALEHLTVGGSEFVEDVPRCFDYIRSKQESLHNVAKNAVKAQQEVVKRFEDSELENKRLREALVRTVWNFELLLAGKPVREATECLDEARAVLAEGTK